MKTIFLLFILFPLFHSVSAQTDTVYWPNGVIRNISSFKNGQRIGLWKSYRQNGALEREGEYDSLGKTGEWKMYYYTGELQSITVHKNGSEYNYEYQSFYQGGQPKLHTISESGFSSHYEEYYRHGVLKSSLESEPHRESTRKEYYKNGALKEIGKFSSRLKDGVWKIYFETGELKRTEDYTERKSGNVWKEYFQNGKLKQTEEFISDSKMRTITEYYPTGEVKRIGRNVYSYSSDYPRRIGEWKEFHKNGELEKNYQFKDGRKVGVWKKFHEDGSLAQIGEFKDGKPIDFWRDYYPSGQLKTIGMYSPNIYRMEKSGIWKDFHENGVLKRTCSHGYRGRGKQSEYYKNGQLKRTGYFGELNNESGEWKEYRKNGQLKRVTEYHEGVISSPIKTYFFHEKMVLKKKKFKVPYTYNDRIAEYKVGKLKFHYANGKLSVVKKCKGKNQKNIYLKFHETGSLSTKEKVKKGDSTGYKKVYFQKERPVFKRIFLHTKEEGKTGNNLKIGEWRSYHDNGNLRQIEMYSSGKLMEVKCSFDREGNEESIGTLKNGTGSVLIYNKNGQAIDLLEYENGVLKRYY